MPTSFQNTLRRDQSPYVKLLNLIRTILPRGPSALRHLTDAQARDIGIPPAEMERLRYQHPSRVMRHPRL